MRLKNQDIAHGNKQAIENLDGVISVVEKGGQFQVVIGPAVPKIYDELIAGTNLLKGEPKDSDEKEDTNWFLKLMDIVGGIFTPLLPLLAGSGVFRGLVLLASQMHWLSTTSSTYTILTCASTAVFYFLPILLAITTAEKFKADKFVAVAIMGALIMPDFIKMMGHTGNGAVVHFFNIPIILMNYSSTVIPAILAIWCFSYLEKWLRKWIPENVQLLFVPLISLFIMVPLATGVFGPFGVYVGEAISRFINWLMNVNGWLAGAFIGGIWNVFVIFGLQWSVVPVMLNNVSTIGYDYIIPLTAAANFGMAGATLGTFFRTKNKKMKTYSMSALLTILFAGITEPAIYGVGVKYKKPLVSAIIGGAAGGAIMGGLKVKGYAFAFGGLTTLPAFVGKTFIPYCIGLLVCFLVACAVTLVIGIGEKKVPEKVVNTEATGNVNSVQNETIMLPISGDVEDLSQAHDEAFSSGSMGEGMVVEPSEGMLYAPFDGSVTMLFKTKHAIGLTSNKGAEVLIHIGIDTVKLNGQYFKAFVKQGDQIKQGQKLIEFDMDAIKKAGYDLSTVVIVTNSHNYNEVKLLETGQNKHGSADLELQI